LLVNSMSVHHSMHVASADHLVVCELVGVVVDGSEHDWYTHTMYDAYICIRYN
jgi:hypothetical protein